MKAISLWQPYASLIALGAKTIETRSWAPPAQYLETRIAIHAAKTPAHLGLCVFEPFALAQPVPLTGHQGFFDVPDDLLGVVAPQGALL